MRTGHSLSAWVISGLLQSSVMDLLSGEVAKSLGSRNSLTGNPSTGTYAQRRDVHSAVLVPEKERSGLRTKIALHMESHVQEGEGDRQDTHEAFGSARDADTSLSGVSLGAQGASLVDRESLENKNKRLARRLYEEVLSQGSYSTMEEIIDENLVDHGAPPELQGIDGQKALLASFRNAFPDLTADIEILLADRAYTVTHFTLSGTHMGEFQSIPATGNRIGIPVTTIMRFADGKLVEMWPQLDMMGLLAQIGAGSAE